MVCLGLEPEAAGRKRKMDTLTYGSPLHQTLFEIYFITRILRFLLTKVYHFTYQESGARFDSNP